MLTPDRSRSDAESIPAPHRRRAKRVKTVPTALAERIADGLLVFEVVGSVLAIGAVHWTVLLCFALPVLIGGLVSVVWLRPPTVRIHAPALLAGGLALYTLFQALPLPMSVLKAIAPTNADVWERALLPFGEHGPAWASLSLDPGASCIEALKWLLYAGVFTLAASMSVRRGAGWGVTVVFASGVFVALVTLGHGLAGATTLYGFYEPHFAVPQWHVSPLLNSNTLAGYLNLAALCGLGLLSASEPILPRWMAGLGVAMMVGVAVVSASRAGVAALPVGFLLLAFLLWTKPRRSQGRAKASPIRSSSWLFVLVASAGILFAALGITPGAWQELYDRNLQKLETIAWVKPLVAAHPWFGIGRGAFESVFPAFKPSPGNTVHAYAENFPAQWISEWGVLVGTVALVLFGWMLRPGHLGVRRSVVCAGAWSGILILLIQNQVDLGLELPSVAIAFAAVFGAIWGDRSRRGRLAGASAGYELKVVAGARWSRLGIAVAASLILVATVGGVRAAPHAVAFENAATYAAFAAIKPDDKAALAALRRGLREPMLRHPAEPYLPLVGAMAARLAKNENAMPWLSRSLERANVNGAAHMMVADVLIERSAVTQALLEVRLAVHDDVALVGAAAQRLLSWTHDYDTLMRAVPGGTAGAGLLEQIAVRVGSEGGGARGGEGEEERQRRQERDRDLRSRIDTETLARDPNLPGPHLRLAGSLVQVWRDRGEGACPGATTEGCEKAVRAHAAVVARASPRTSEADRLVVDWLTAAGRLGEADELLERRCDEVEDRASCLSARLALAVVSPGVGVGTAGTVGAGTSLGAGASSLGAAHVAQVAKELAGASCAEGRSVCARTCTWIGDMMSSRGDFGGAVSYYGRAAVEEPSEARYMLLANAAARIGAHGQAADALEKVQRLRGRPDQDIAKRIGEERLQAIGGLTRGH